MKNTITHTAEWILLAIVTVLLCYTAWKSYTLKNEIEYITVTDTIFVSDTITNMGYDTIYFSHFDTVQLPAVVINDTLVKIDSVFVQIPISTTVYDTIIQKEDYQTHLKATVTGFNSTLDEVLLETTVFKKEPVIQQEKWYQRFGIGVGVMVGTGGVGVGGGIMYKL